MRRVTLLVFTLALVAGCLPTAMQFACASSSQCGAGGACEPDGFCSFVDSSCPSGRRYGQLAGLKSDKCVSDQFSLIDAGVDAPPDAPPDVCFFGVSFQMICVRELPTTPLVFSNPTMLDTANSSSCVPVTRGRDACVLAGTTITIESTLRATGLKPLVLIASDAISIVASGTVDVGSRSGAAPDIGAGAGGTECLAAPGILPTSNEPGGGGAGATFAGAGGNGGTGGVTGGLGGISAPSREAFQLVGGCPGQDGAGSKRGLGGPGGGAVLLIAGNRIEVAGTIQAGGGGGGAGMFPGGGGGGGGSGGMIALDAPVIVGTGTIVANGGGGGEGGGSTAGGNPGANAIAVGPALGGTLGAVTGGDGGEGSAQSSGSSGKTGQAGTVGNPPLNNGGGGGGGGGGAGVVKAPLSANLGGNVSPAPTQ